MNIADAVAEDPAFFHADLPRPAFCPVPLPAMLVEMLVIAPNFPAWAMIFDLMFVILA